MNLSVIINTYNRGAMLARTLRLLLDQTAPADSFEIVIADDGSTDDTAALVKELGDRAPGRIRYFYQENAGRAAARNLGLREAKHDLVLFMGDDCLPVPEFIAEHLKAHAAEKDVAVLGHIAWHPELKKTLLMEFLDMGVQFGFRYIKDPENAPFWCFYTSNCSLRRHWIDDVGGFDPDFVKYGYEDSELAYRMHQAGLRLIYRPAALVYHHHDTSFASFLVRQRMTGRASVIFWRKHPELRVPLGIEAAGSLDTGLRFYGAVAEYVHALGVREALRGQPQPGAEELEDLNDPELVASSRAWVREVFDDKDPQWQEVLRLSRELSQVRGEYERVTSRKLYRLTEKLAVTGWKALRLLGLKR